MIRRVAAVFAMVMIAISFFLKLMVFWLWTYGYDTLVPLFVADENYYLVAELAHFLDGAALLFGLLVFLGAFVFTREDPPAG